MAEEIKKLITRQDIMRDIDENITPKYFPSQTLDKNRTSVYGWLAEALSASIEDTITLEQRRALDYCPELSSSEIHVNQAAKLRGIGANRATPGSCYAFLGVLKNDILRRGTKYGNNEIRFIIDRRSTILYGGFNFSLPDDIIIRAVKRTNGTYLFSANYMEENPTYDTYVMTYEYVNEAGEELIAMVAQLYQMKYNISERHVTDEIEFTYDGLYYPYSDQLAGFDVYYKQSGNDSFKQASLDHYLTSEPAASKCLYYDDDETGVVKIMNNPYLNVGANSTVRVEIRETLGAAGNGITVNGTDIPSFELYQDSSYSYSGVYVIIDILSDVTGGTDGDDALALKKRLIDAKTRRDNLTTEHDIISYINDVDANVQLEKKRNDIQDRRYYMYTLMRYGDRRLAPTTTKRLEVVGLKKKTQYSFQNIETGDITNVKDYYLLNPETPNRLTPLARGSLEDIETGEESEISPYGDFDYYDPVTDRKVIRAYGKFKLVIVPTSPGDDLYPDADYAVKIPHDTREIRVGSEYERSKLTVGDLDGQVRTGDIVRVLRTNGLDTEVDSITYLVIDDTKVGTEDWEEAYERSYYLTCPYLIVIDRLNFCHYYFNSVDYSVNLTMKHMTNIFPYQMICRQISIYRDSHDAENHEKYRLTVKASINTENDGLLVNLDESSDDYLEIFDKRKIVCVVVLPMNENPTAYIAMETDSYNESSREFIFTGEMETDDFITENDKLHITKGPKRLGSDEDFDGVIDYANGTLQVCFLYKLAERRENEDGESALVPVDDNESLSIADFPRDDDIYTTLPETDVEGYVLMSRYYNNSSNPYHLILSFDKFSGSPVKVTMRDATTYAYSIGEVPFFEYDFGTANTASLYPTFKNMNDVYSSMLKRTTDFEVALKFLATYGPSKYLYVHGGRFDWSYEENGSYETLSPLYDLNPTIFFKVYGFGAPVDEIYNDIYEYLRDSYNTAGEVFMSNICTEIERKYPSVRSIKFMGINNYDGSYQHLIFNKPTFTSSNMVNRYIPEQVNITDIRIELDETIV